jgi:hypothetical protein
MSKLLTTLSTGFCIVAVGFSVSAFLPMLPHGGKLDPYNVFMNDPGNSPLSSADPKLLEQHVLAECNVAGKSAKYGWFTYSSFADPSAPAQGRMTSSKLYVIAREMPDGNSVSRAWRGEEYKGALESEWTERWGCKL